MITCRVRTRHLRNATEVHNPEMIGKSAQRGSIEQLFQHRFCFYAEETLSEFLPAGLHFNDAGGILLKSHVVVLDRIMVSGIVLCAGSSRRMGVPKCLLKLGDKTFLQHVVDVLHSARILDVVVVLGAEAETIQRTLGWFTGKVVVNPNWEKGRLTSVIAGLDALETKDLHGAMVCPVDHPLISQSLFVDLLQAFWKSKKNIIIPSFNGRRGHPVIFSVELFDELRNAPLDLGARAVVHHHPDDIAEVPTDEEGVVLNIDTPDDYEIHILQRAV